MNRKPVFYLSLFLLLFHSSSSLIVTLMPTFFQEKGLTASEIGWLMAIGPFTALFSQPFFGYMSDKYKTVKRMVIFCLGGVLFSSFFVFHLDSFFPLLFLCGVFFSFMSPVGALGDSLAQKTAVMYGTEFGQIRMWGSIGFAVTALIAGNLLAKIGLDYLFYVYLFYTCLTFLIVQKIVDVPASSKAINLKKAMKVVSRPSFMWFLIMIMFIAITHRANDTFIGLYITELGGSESQIGLAWFIGVAAEALVFMFSAYWLKLFKNEMTFVIIAAALFSLRWFLYAGLTEPAQVILLQPMHGISFGVFYLCTFQMVTKLIPEEFLATGQMVFISAFFGLAGIIGSLAGGWIIEFTGGAKALYQVLGGLALIGFLGFIFYKQAAEKNNYFFKKSGLVFKRAGK